MESVVKKTEMDSNVVEMIVVSEHPQQQQQQQQEHHRSEQFLNNDNHMMETSQDSFDITDHSLRISRHFITLLDEYRYLMSCLMNTCNCHSNFDYQFFLRKLESRYNKLTNLVSADSSVSQLLNPHEETSIEQLIEQSTMNRMQDNKQIATPFIHRVRICERSKSSSMMNRDMITIDDDDDDGDGVGHNEEDEGGFFDLPKFDISLKDAQIAYKCSHPKCEFLSFSQDDLIDHLKDHSSGTTTTIKANDIETKREIVYVCDQCGKEFAGQKWLDNHVDNVHTYTRLFHCDYPACTYSSKFRCVMEDHKRRHMKNKDFKCSWHGCDSEFVTKRDMVAHINFYHKGIKNYQCSWPNCDASFKDSNRLKHHYYTHTGERPYKCDVCDSSFKQAPHLYKHKRIHAATGIQQQHRQTMMSTRSSSAMYICPEPNCQRKFRTSNDLERHQKLLEHRSLIIKMEDDINIYQCAMPDCQHQLFHNQDDLEQHINDKHSYELNNTIKLENV
ncbi:uncharacterized protein LOC113794607 isoform X1 [Dermatophagoides pteronyssinus]|uniref:Zinc finger protein 483-like isoform X1 n=1 Tax=Dermatophagoides pteronyssinus TaxID=6956 RepID=A0A6P6Y7M0_DERPT|nr:zinc finger protein 483-like isoform X1 [Dermatophagoides pteronyssinus]